MENVANIWKTYIYIYAIIKILEVLSNPSLVQSLRSSCKEWATAGPSAGYK
jgi:hypothetical protein